MTESDQRSFRLRHLGRLDPESNLLVTQITADELRGIPEYTLTLPNDPRPGFVWKFRGRAVNPLEPTRAVLAGEEPNTIWFLGICYDVVPEEGTTNLRNMLTWRRVEIVAASQLP